VKIRPPVLAHSELESTQFCQ